MVAQNLLWSGWGLKRFQATVINDIWPEVAFFTLVATMVVLVSEKTSHDLGISSSLLTVLGTVLGLVISFRTSTAYERYQEGRKLWTVIGLASRNLAHMIWNHVPNERDGKAAPAPTVAVPVPNVALAAVIEKKSMINLVQAFSVSVKHMLRGEPGIYYEDLYPLACWLPRYASAPIPSAAPSDADLLPLWKASQLVQGDRLSARARAPAAHGSPDPEKLARMHSDPGHVASSGDGSGTANSQSHTRSHRGARRKHTFDPEAVLADVASDVPLQPARNPPKSSLYDYLPLLRVFKPIVGLFRARVESPNDGGRRSILGHKKMLAHVESNVPLELTLFLSSYLAWLLKKGLLTPAIATAITNNISTLQECSVNLTRIRNTPLPFAYQAHLRMSLWLYLLFLPFQIYSGLKYVTIPATAFASFLLLGFLEIGQEIENPFEYDLNDLDLDGFCLQIQRELAEITAHTVPEPDTYLFTSSNQPFAPADRRGADRILADVEHAYHGPETGMDTVRRTLLRSWGDVDAQTREHYSGHEKLGVGAH